MKQESQRVVASFNRQWKGHQESIQRLVDGSLTTNGVDRIDG